jgi:hypothetical protein
LPVDELARDPLPACMPELEYLELPVFELVDAVPPLLADE